MSNSIPLRIADYQVWDQVSGVIVDQHNLGREADKLEALQHQDEAFLEAVSQIDKVRSFVGTPEHILGSPGTKHGEIAEQVEVGVQNARRLVEQMPVNANFGNVPRTGPTDYIIGGADVQSKFINGANNSLSHVMDHMGKYPKFTQGNTYYHVPKGQYEIMRRIQAGEDIPDLNKHSEKVILEKIKEITESSGRPFDDVVRPSISRYDEVQQGKIHQTLDDHQEQIRARDEEVRSEIIADHDPSGIDAIAPIGVAAVVGGAVCLTSKFYGKVREGKNPFLGDFTKEDWKEIGISSAKGAGGGAIAGGSIYLLTNYADLSAPFAGAAVSAVKGITSLTQQFNNGQITQEQFVQLGMVTCAESACVGISTAVGQTLIPIPVLGSVIGSVAGKMLVEISREFRLSNDLQNRITEEMDLYLSRLDQETRAMIKIINHQYEQLSSILSAAFDPKANVKVKFERSVEVAQIFGGLGPILTSLDEIDDYFQG